MSPDFDPRNFDFNKTHKKDYSFGDDSRKMSHFTHRVKGNPQISNISVKDRGTLSVEYRDEGAVDSIDSVYDSLMGESTTIDEADDENWMLGIDFKSDYKTRGKEVISDLRKRFKKVWGGSSAIGVGFDVSFNGPKKVLQKVKTYVEKTYKGEVVPKHTIFTVLESVGLHEDDREGPSQEVIDARRRKKEVEKKEVQKNIKKGGQEREDRKKQEIEKRKEIIQKKKERLSKERERLEPRESVGEAAVDWRTIQKKKTSGSRQLKDPKTEVMVSDKKGKVIVIDKKDLKRYTSKGWKLAESVKLDEARYTRGGRLATLNTRWDDALTALKKDVTDLGKLYKKNDWKGIHEILKGLNQYRAPAFKDAIPQANYKGPIETSPTGRMTDSVEHDLDEGKKKHHCAKHVEHAEYGAGRCILSQHATPNKDGIVEWYDVMFEHGLEKQVSVDELKILISEVHEDHGAGEEGTKKLLKKYKKDTPYSEASGHEGVCKEIHPDMSHAEWIQKGQKTRSHETWTKDQKK